MGLMTAPNLSGSSRRRMLLPPEGALFIRRRIEEIVGLALVVISAMLLLAWLSYAPTDPSPLRAAPGPVKNLFGAIGAGCTDVGVQAFGLGYLLFIAVLAIWGWRLFAHRGLKNPTMRLIALMVAVLTSSLAFGAMPITTGVDLPTGPGGAIGQLVLGRVLSLGPWVGGIGAGTIGIVVAIFAGLATFVAIGFGGGNWKQNLQALSALSRHDAPVPAARISYRVSGTLGASPLGASAVGASPLGASARGPSDHGLTDRTEPVMASPAAVPPNVAMPTTLFVADPVPAAGRLEPTIAPPRKTGFASFLRRTPSPEAPAPRQLALPLAAAPASAADVPLDLLPGESSHLPPVTLLADGVPLPANGATSEAAGAQGRLLIAALADFGVAAMMTAVRAGPITTSYELEPAPGVKTARVIGLADEIGLALGVSCIRIAALPGTARPMIIVELPNRDRAMLTLRGLLSDPGFERTAARLTIALGRDGPGAPVFADLGRLPHLLIAGARSSGRTTLLHSLLLSVLYRLPSEECRLLLINPGQPSAEGASLSDYADIPHLLTPVVTDPEEGLRALRWTVREMEQRYRSMAKIGVRNVESYNQRVDELASESARRMRTVQIGFNPVDGTPLYEEMQMDLSPLPLILVVIDDLGPLMRIGAMETEAAIQRLSQMARAVGIHMLVTCGAAGTDGLTPSVKSQFASRICLRTLSRPDSRAVIGESGAEQLLGPGDALYMSPGGRVTRLHPALVGKEELAAIVRFLRSQGAPRYVSGVVSLEAALNSTKMEPMVAA